MGVVPAMQQRISVGTLVVGNGKRLCYNNICWTTARLFF